MTLVALWLELRSDIDGGSDEYDDCDDDADINGNGDDIDCLDHVWMLLRLWCQASLSRPLEVINPHLTHRQGKGDDDDDKDNDYDDDEWWWW